MIASPITILLSIVEKVSVPVYNNDVCAAPYLNKFRITIQPWHLCAGAIEGGRGSCYVSFFRKLLSFESRETSARDLKSSGPGISPLNSDDPFPGSLSGRFGRPVPMSKSRWPMVSGRSCVLRFRLRSQGVSRRVCESDTLLGLDPKHNGAKLIDTLSKPVKDVHRNSEPRINAVSKIFVAIAATVRDSGDSFSEH